METSVEQPQSSEKKKSKKPLKIIIWLLVIAALGYGAWQGLTLLKPEASGPRINPLTLVPETSLFIIETEKPYKIWKELSETQLWSLLEQDPEYKDYGEMLSELEDQLSGLDKALNLFSNRTTYVSMHPYRKDRYDFLYILDMEGLGVVRTWMTSQDHVSKRTFENSTIYEQLDLKTKETLYFAFENNYMVASFTHALVEDAIREKADPTLSRSFEFIDVRKKVVGEGLGRIYLNYDRIYHYATYFMKPEDIEGTKDRFPFIYSGMAFDVDTDQLLLEGFSSYADSLTSYLSLFGESGYGDCDIAKVLPAGTSVYMSQGFDSFEKFYEQLSEMLANDPITGDDFKLYTARTEKFLNINIVEDVASWIDDEIATVQIETDKSSETAIILKAKSASLANEKMAFLSKQIKRKTPVRFKAVEYEGYTIHYMAVKGFFNLILGKLFKKYDRPYYAIVDEYVIFTAKPSTLRHIIDQYTRANTLSRVPEYKRFIKSLGSNHSMMLYMQLNLLEQSQDGVLDAETVAYLKSKKGFLQHFPQMGFKVSPDGEMFKSRLLLSVNNAVMNLEETLVDGPAQELFNYDSLFNVDPGEQIEVADIEIEDLGAKSQSEAYEDGTERYEVEIKDGQKHGNYFEYHPSGELKIKGKYKNDLQEGTWKYYDSLGVMIKREKYNKGVLQN